MEPLSNVRVVSDGIGPGTRVLVNGDEVTGVLSIAWEMESANHVGVLTLRIEGAEADLAALRVQIDGEDECVLV